MSWTQSCLKIYLFQQSCWLVVCVHVTRVLYMHTCVCMYMHMCVCVTCVCVFVCFWSSGLLHSVRSFSFLLNTLITFFLLTLFHVTGIVLLRRNGTEKNTLLCYYYYYYHYCVKHDSKLHQIWLHQAFQTRHRKRIHTAVACWQQCRFVSFLPGYLEGNETLLYHPETDLQEDSPQSVSDSNFVPVFVDNLKDEDLRYSYLTSVNRNLMMVVSAMMVVYDRQYK